MTDTKTDTIAPPPGVVGSLRAGFDTIASHITAILLPVFLDLLLWLGPRVSIERLFLPGVKNWVRIGTAGDATQAARQLEFYRNILQELNLLAILRGVPIGISSLMTSVNPAVTPYGDPPVYQVGSYVSLVGWIAVLFLVAWVGGALYFRWVAGLVDPDAAAGSTRNGNPIIHSLGLSGLWAFAACTIGVPVMLLLGLLFTINPLLLQTAILFLSVLSMWVLVPLFFSPMGIFMRGQNLFGSILTGVQLARFTLPASSLFVLSVLLIGIGMNLVWSIPPAESWMSLVGILGHAFITTALLAASFIYYRDMTVWLQNVLERIKAGTAAPQT